jgi:hypothetical protein
MYGMLKQLINEVRGRAFFLGKENHSDSLFEASPVFLGISMDPFLTFA